MGVTSLAMRLKNEQIDRIKSFFHTGTNSQELFTKVDAIIFVMAWSKTTMAF